ncbi:hypothetical protein ACLKA7_015727 [Drosophila subpalustris]
MTMASASASRFEFAFEVSVKVIDDHLIDDLMAIPKTTNSGAMLTTKKSLTNLLPTSISATTTIRIRVWIDEDGFMTDLWLLWPLLVDKTADYNRSELMLMLNLKTLEQTAFAFY